jgi:hypothetical protein
MTRFIRIATLAAITVLAALAALPASANNVPRTGDKIGLLCVAFGTCPAEQSYPAGTPFFVAHGYCEFPDLWKSLVDPGTRFELEIDGQSIHTITDLELGLGRDPEGVCKMNVANMRFGLPAGRHSLVGRWYAAGQLQIVAVKTVAFT